MAVTESITSSSLQLPCGLVLKNRLVKSAMSEKLAVDLYPTYKHQQLYTRRAQGGWAALIAGHIMVDDRHLGSPGDVAVSGSRPETLHHWSAWTGAVQEKDCHMIAQLNHPGRQSPLGAGKRSVLSKTLAPSAVPLDIGDNWFAHIARALLFGTPRAMTQHDIDVVIAQFTIAAKLALEAGFQGVEVHAGHGFLLSQFMSSSSNKRTDDFGGSAEKRTELLLRIIRSIRAEVPSSFCVGVKINAADHMNQQAVDEMLRQIELIQREATDYINLSGGSYEDPLMFSTCTANPATTVHAEQASVREGFFLQASQEIRKKFPHLVIFLTGGFRSRDGFNAAIDTGSCNVVGIGRPAVKYPDLPNRFILNKESFPSEQTCFDVEAAPSAGWIATKVRSMQAGAETKYWASLMRS